MKLYDNQLQEMLNILKYQLIFLSYLVNMDDEVNWQRWRKINNLIALTNSVESFFFKNNFFVRKVKIF